MRYPLIGNTFVKTVCYMLLIGIMFPYSGETAENFKSVHVLNRFLSGLREQGYNVVSELVPGVRVDVRLNNYVDSDEVTVVNLVNIMKGSGYLVTVSGQSIVVAPNKNTMELPNPMDKHVDRIHLEGTLTEIFQRITKDNSIDMALMAASTYHNKLKFEFQGGSVRECLAELATQSKLAPKGYAVNLGKSFYVGSGQSKEKKEWYVAMVTFCK